MRQIVVFLAVAVGMLYIVQKTVEMGTRAQARR